MKVLYFVMNIHEYRSLFICRILQLYTMEPCQGRIQGGGGGAVILRFQNSFLTALKGKKT